MQPSDLNLTAVYAAAVSAAAALIGVIVASLFATRTARLNHREQRAHRMDERRLDRLEELHMLFDRWEMNFSQIYLLHLRYFKGKLSFVQVMDLVKELDVLGKEDLQRMNMILAMYAEPLSKDYQQVQEARKRIVPFLAESAPSSLSEAAFIGAQEHFERTAEDFKLLIAQLAKAGFLDKRVP